MNIVSFVVLRRYKQRQTLGILSTRFSNLEIPVSLLIPAYNEELRLPRTLRALRRLEARDEEEAAEFHAATEFIRITDEH